MDKYKTTFNSWNKLAHIYQEKFMNLSLYDDTYDLFCNYLKKDNPTILEIGCGPGNITKYLLSKRPDFRIDAIDVAPNMVQLAQENNPAANCIVMDARAIDQLPGQYDAIMVGFCLPYLSKGDCNILITNSSASLRRDGILYLSFIEGDYEQSGFETGSTGDSCYVYYHQIEFLEKCLSENKIKLLNSIRKTYPKANGTKEVHLILIAQKTKFSQFKDTL